MSFNPEHYVHPSDKAALKALRAIPGFHQFVRAFMRIWSERQLRVINMSSNVRINENQLPEYYNMLPPICEKLGIEVPELYLSLNVVPNAETHGDTKPYIVINSGLLETIPFELVPSVLAHECGHIACHHVLYTTMGSMLFNSSSSVLSEFTQYAKFAMLPLEVAFYYWMRCSELSADRAAVLCDGSADKTSEVCLRLAGYDKDINEAANFDEFLSQAKEYREMTSTSSWNKALEFLLLSNATHPLTTVRALECREWAETDQFKAILNGTYDQEEEETIAELTDVSSDDESNKDKKAKPRLEIPKFMRKPKPEDVQEAPSALSGPEEIRQYKQLLDEGIITEEEFAAKKKQILGI